MNWLSFVGASMWIGFVFASFTVEEIAEEIPRIDKEIPEIVKEKLFFDGEEQFVEHFSSFFLNLPNTYQELREVFLLKDREFDLIDLDLFSICFGIEESGYATEGLEKFLRFLKKKLVLNVEEKNTLTHPVCQRSLAAAIASIESAEEQARLFNRLSPEIVSNSLILESFSDFSRFEPSKMFKQVAEFVLVSGMFETGSPELIHAILEIRNYELDWSNISTLLQKRPEIFALPLFKHDPYIIAAITRFNPFTPLIDFDAVEGFIQAFKRQSGKKLQKSLVEQVVLFWIRSEAIINSHIYFLESLGGKFVDIESGNEIPAPAPEPIYSLIRKEFEDRNRLISKLARFSNTLGLIDLLQTCLNLKLCQIENQRDCHCLIETIGPLPYSQKLKTVQEIEAAFLEFGIKSKQWTLNFYTALIPFGHPSVSETMLQARKSLCSQVFPNPFEQLTKEERLVSGQVENEQENLNFMQNMAKASNNLSRVYDQMNLTDPAFFAFLSQESRESLDILAKFAHLIRPQTIRKWLEMAEGRAFLRTFPQITNKLPTLNDFSAQDFLEFGLKLDSEELLNPHSLSHSTTAALLEEAECIFSISSNVIHRINSACLKWPMVSAWAMMSDSSLERAEAWISMLNISQVFDVLNEMNDSELLGFVAHWLVHMEWNVLWMMLVAELPMFIKTELRAQIVSMWNNTEALGRLQLVEILSSRLEGCGEDAAIRRHFQLLVEALKPTCSITALRVGILKRVANVVDQHPGLFNADGSPKSWQEITDFSRQLNAGIQEVLMANLRGSERKRRVILNQAQAMSMLHADAKIPVEKGKLDWKSGKFPLDDSITMWLIENRVDLLRCFIRMKISSDKFVTGDEYVDGVLGVQRYLMTGSL